MAGASTGGALLGVFTVLLGLGAILAALRRRRRRASYPETYAATGGIVYTGVQMGCGAVLLVTGVGLIVLAVIFRQ